jgi:hypothetical protein
LHKIARNATRKTCSSPDFTRHGDAAWRCIVDTRYHAADTQRPGDY